MRIVGVRRHLIALVLAVIAVISAGQVTRAVSSTSTSPHYQVSETQFGSGATLDSCSGQYCAQASIGDMATGRSKSPSSTATFGSNTDSAPLLEVIIDPGQSNLGTLTTEKTASKTMIVKIRNYLSSGYIMQIVGVTPQYNGHSLQALTTPAASKAGTEQFGMNIVANTSPQLGAAPVQVPSANFSYGKAEPGYDVANQFKYVSDDVIARSNSETGETDYTISMIINVSNTTPAGHYSADYAAIVTPTY